MKTRFGMVKERHAGTFAAAVEAGRVDGQMRGLCGFLAESRGFFTSSCCSGRIMLLGLRGGSKKDSYFHRKWHRTVSFDEVWAGMEADSTGTLWFKCEPFILHVGCAGLGDANRVLDAMKEAGVKRGGIILAEEGKYLIELQGTNRIVLPVKEGSEILVDKTYLGRVLEKANQRLEANYARLEKLERVFRERLA